MTTREKINQSIIAVIGQNKVCDSLPAINKMLDILEKEIIINAEDWIKAMWNIDMLDHDGWDDIDEALASLKSYLKGNHKKL